MADRQRFDSSLLAPVHLAMTLFDVRSRINFEDWIDWTLQVIQDDVSCKCNEISAYSHAITQIKLGYLGV